MRMMNLRTPDSACAARSDSPCLKPRPITASNATSIPAIMRARSTCHARPWSSLGQASSPDIILRTRSGATYVRSAVHRCSSNWSNGTGSASIWTHSTDPQTADWRCTSLSPTRAITTTSPTDCRKTCNSPPGGPAVSAGVIGKARTAWGWLRSVATGSGPPRSASLSGGHRTGSSTITSCGPCR